MTSRQPIFSLELNPDDRDRYHSAIWGGTRIDHTKCIACGRSSWHLEAPYWIEWTRDRWSGRSKRVGDFVWPSGSESDLVVQSHVKDFMTENCLTRYDFMPVESRDGHLRNNRKKRPLVENPPPLWIMKIHMLQFDGERSQRRLVDECSVCGYRGWAFYGGNDTRRCLIVPIEKDRGVPDIFKIEGMPMCFCSERFMSLVTQAEFSNVMMLPWGFAVS